jgi:cyclopropane fatty-acyl-phospholipid synthase-like methyltransferase
MTKPRPSFRELKTADDVAAYMAGMEERWPARPLVIRHIVEQLTALPFAPLSVLELCLGAGALAEQLLQHVPALQYVGIDSSQPMLAFARTRLASWGKRATIIDADLNRHDWIDLAARHSTGGKFHAIVSMQSLHDLGGEPEVNRIYGVAKGLLASGGLFLNADLVVAPGEELPDNPGRRSIPRHRELLQAHGYHGVVCTFAEGGFGMIVGYV